MSPSSNDRGEDSNVVSSAPQEEAGTTAVLPWPVIGLGPGDLGCRKPPVAMVMVAAGDELPVEAVAALAESAVAMAVADYESHVEIATAVAQSPVAAAAAAPFASSLMTGWRRRWALSISGVIPFLICGLSCGLTWARGVV